MRNLAVSVRVNFQPTFTSQETHALSTAFSSRQAIEITIEKSVINSFRATVNIFIV